MQPMKRICMKCLKGTYQKLPEEILSDGSVVLGGKCDNCGNIEQYQFRPNRSIRYTGIIQCEKCGYEYFYCTEMVEDIFDIFEIKTICPSCDVIGYQKSLTEEYGELKHKHGKYGEHPVIRKHR